jgi:hypothetical protein
MPSDAAEDDFEESKPSQKKPKQGAEQRPTKPIIPSPSLSSRRKPNKIGPTSIFNIVQTKQQAAAQQPPKFDDGGDDARTEEDSEESSEEEVSERSNDDDSANKSGRDASGSENEALTVDADSDMNVASVFASQLTPSKSQRPEAEKPHRTPPSVSVSSSSSSSSSSQASKSSFSSSTLPAGGDVDSDDMSEHHAEPSQVSKKRRRKGGLPSGPNVSAGIAQQSALRGESLSLCSYLVSCSF